MANFYISSGTSFSATINITYPAGSICTVSNYKKTWTAPNTTGSWTFKANEVGIYTVKAVNGNDSGTKEVKITAADQTINITVQYKQYLFQTGSGSGDITWKTLVGGYTSASVSTTSLTMNGGSSVYYTSSVAITTDSSIDLTSYSKLYFDIQSSVLSAAWIGVSKNKYTRGSETSTITRDNATAYTDITTTDRIQIAVDISGLSGFYYVFQASDGLNVVTNGYNVWLE